MLKKVKVEDREFHFKKFNNQYYLKGKDLLEYLGYNNNTLIYRNTEEIDRRTNEEGRCFVWLNSKAIRDVLDNGSKVRDDQREFITKYIIPELQESKKDILMRNKERLEKRHKELTKEIADVENKLKLIKEVVEIC